MIAAEIIGLGAAAVPLITGSSGEPPAIALANPDKPAIMLAASKMLKPEPVTVLTCARLALIDGYAILVPTLKAIKDRAALTIRILSMRDNFLIIVVF
jgi:hypothetical protein